MSTLAPTLQMFFTQRLLSERQASPHTVAAYRDSFRLLLGLITAHLGKAPSQLLLTDLDVTVIDAFLNHLEHDRGNSARTRNARLVAIHSLFRFAELRHPDHAHMIQRVLAVPAKRQQRTEVSFLTPTEVDALLAAPIVLRASVGATMRCSSWLCRPACVFPNWSAYAAVTSISTVALTYAATAKDAKIASRRLPSRLSRCSRCGSANSLAALTLTPRCFPASSVVPSAVMQSSVCWQSTPALPRSRARPWAPRGFHHMYCATLRRCGSWRRALILP